MRPGYYLDTQKRYWYRRPENGEWLYHNGQEWVKGNVPAEVLAQYSEKQNKSAAVPTQMDSKNKAGKATKMDMLLVGSTLIVLGLMAAGIIFAFLAVAVYFMFMT
jgi:hypothetical protein